MFNGINTSWRKNILHKNPTNIGVYKIDDENVYIIDSGNDSDAGKKILKIIEEKGWKVKGIINTHSNADHIGGNKLIQDRTNCDIYAYNIEKSFTENPSLEPSFLYGGFPFKDLQNKFLMAKESNINEIYCQSSNGNIASSKVIENNGGIFLYEEDGSKYYKIILK